MELRGRSAVITGAGSGIGRALAIRFAAEGARAVVAVDLDRAEAAATAAAVRAAGAAALEVAADVAVWEEVAGFVRAAEDAFGPLDLVVSNAGIAVGGGVDVADAAWQRIWDVNVMAHVYAARATLPAMLARGEGYLLNTASAAGLLTSLGAAPYAVTKHAAVALAEWLAITYGDAGIRVSCLCPQWVRTPMLESLLTGGADGAGGAGGADGAAAGTGGAGGGTGGAGGGTGGAGGDPAGTGSTGAPGAGGEFVPADVRTTPEEVAEAVVAGVREERFLILPHPEVAGYFRMRGDDHERWLRGMRRLQASPDRPSARPDGAGRG